MQYTVQRDQVDITPDIGLDQFAVETNMYPEILGENSSSTEVGTQANHDADGQWESFGATKVIACQ